MAMAATDGAPPLRVMVVDDHEVVRDGIKALLNKADGILVVGEAGTVREAVACAEAVQTGAGSTLPARSARAIRAHTS